MSEPPSAEAIVEQLKQARVEFVASVPDKMTARLTELIERDSSFRFIPLCKEDEGVSICSALSFADRRAVLIIQHTGFMDSINSIQGVATDFRQPLVMIIGLLNKEPGIKPRESKRVGVSLTEPLLEVLKIPHVLVDVRGDETRIARLVEEAYSTSNPIAILIGREVV